MLGWEIFVSRQRAGERALATWKVGLGGAAWLDELVSLRSLDPQELLDVEAWDQS